jgi:membrane carboxypeptidase/penicillin-binding protein PbpC
LHFPEQTLLEEEVAGMAEELFADVAAAEVLAEVAEAEVLAEVGLEEALVAEDLGVVGTGTGLTTGDPPS